MEDDHFCVLFLHVVAFEEATKGRQFTFTDIYLKNFVGEPSFSEICSQFEKQRSREVVKEAFKTAFGCEVPINVFRVV